MHHPLSNPARVWCRLRMWLLPVVVLLCVSLPHLDQGDWMRGDGSWYGAIGVQAWRSGSLWTLFAEPGVEYFNKPPLILWVHGLMLHVFGVGPVQARLPTVLAASVCVVATVGLCRVGARHGWALSRHASTGVGVVLALSIEFFRRTREISMDMWQAAFMLLCVWMVMQGVGSRRGWLIMLAGVPVGLALLTKPFMALLALILLGVWMVWIGRWRMVGWLVGAVVVAGLVAAPWHVGMVLEHGDEFVRQYFGAEILDRAEGKRSDAKHVRWWYYFEKIALNNWPWVVFVLLGLVSWGRGERLTRAGVLERWAVVWAVGWLIALTLFPDRRDRYGLPIWPAMAVLAGAWLGRWPWGWLRRVQRQFLSRWWVAFAGIALVFALLPIRVQEPVHPQWPATLAWLDEEQPAALWTVTRQTHRMARLYLERGQWPEPTHNRWNEQVGQPQPGAVLMYDTNAGVVPGVNERVVFEAGDLVFTTLVEGEWSPRW